MKKKFFILKRSIALQRFINGLTFFRMLLGLPIIFALVNSNKDIFILLIALGGLTDFFDGYIARKYDHQSTLGAKLDPLADKILLLGPMIWLAVEDLVPIWAIWLIISRELLITSWRSGKSTGGPASVQGKLKTALQFSSLILLLWPHDWGSIYTVNLFNQIGYALFWISLFLSYSSAIRYFLIQKETHQS